MALFHLNQWKEENQTASLLAQLEPIRLTKALFLPSSSRKVLAEDVHVGPTATRRTQH